MTDPVTQYLSELRAGPRTPEADRILAAVDMGRILMLQRRPA
jgi:hypothetical protein